jgi:UDP-GlcNAc:undecaprenyl-phosphate GlcNAc-1-phosphate transferase
LTARRSWHEADKDHIHHRLLRLGHGYRRAVLILYAWTALLSGVVLIPTFTGRGNSLLTLLIGGVLVALFTFLRPTGHDIDRPSRSERRASRRAARRAVRQSA